MSPWEFTNVAMDALVNRRHRERHGCRRDERDRPIDGGRRCAIGRDGDVRWAEDEELLGTVKVDLPAQEWDGEAVRRPRLAADYLPEHGDLFYSVKIQDCHPIGERRAVYGG